MANSEGSHIDADPDGDIIFVLGRRSPAETTIRVSSKVLSLASDYFVDSFRANFSEGSVPQSSTNPHYISLEKVDPEAMVWTCKALHYHEHITTKTPLSLLTSIAALCDKYNLSRALRPWSQACVQYRLQCCKPSSPNPEDHDKLMHCSKLFDSHEGFNYSSSKLLSSCHDMRSLELLETDSTAAQDRIKLLSTSLWRCNNNATDASLVNIDVERDRLKQLFQDAMDQLLAEASAQDSDSDTLIHITTALSSASLWPPFRSFHDLSIDTLLIKFRNVSQCQNSGPKRPRCQCNRLGVSRRFRAIADQVTTELKGLCLKCVRNGKYSVAEGNCTARTQAECRER